MKRAKKLLAILLTMAMTLGMTATAFASGTTPAGAQTTAEAKVLNVEEGAKVFAYQIVAATYSGEGFTGYHAVDAVKNEFTDPTSVSASDLTIEKTKAIAEKILNGTYKLEATELNGTDTIYSASLAAGSWVVLVQASQKVYNPMLLSLYYTEASAAQGTLSGGSLDATGEYFLANQEVYAKASDEPTIEKKIVNADGASTNGHGNDVAVGGIVKYEISANIPPYDASAYKSVVVKISDQLSDGLDLQKDSFIVKVGSDDPKEDTDYTFEKKEDHAFTIVIDSKYALDHAGQKIQVNYDAKLNNNASVNFDPNTNTAAFEYTNDPYNTTSTNKVDDKTYTYTFAIGAKLYGESEDYTNIIKKTGEEETIPGTKDALANATFELRQGSNVISTCMTGDDGLLKFTGLDAGDYTLVETQAPDGYSLADKPYNVRITATYKANGQLDTYKIIIDDKDITDTTPSYTYKATYDTNDNLTDVGFENGSKKDPTEIPNTKLANLPSTGGIGTTIFTVVGCIVMIAAAGLFFASRRKAAAK